MSFKIAYKKVKPSIVAVCSKVSSRPDYPDIIGTGIIIDSSGLILTNHHVIKAVKSIPKHEKLKDEDWPIFCMLYHFIEDKGMAEISLDVKAAMGVQAYSSKVYYGDVPDIGVLCVDMHDLPSVDIKDTFDLEDGDRIGIAGFPMGTNTLRAPGWLHHFGPSLKVAHVSAVLPFQCEHPHAFLIDSMMQGGNSGSIVFNEAGQLVGVLYGGLSDISALKIGKLKIPYKIPTNLSYAVPCQLVNEIVNRMKSDKFYKSHKIKTRSLNKFVSETQPRINQPKKTDVKNIDKLKYS